MMTTLISSQAKELKKSLEGSETRLRAKAVMSPRVPWILTINLVDRDIVRHLGESLRMVLNRPYNGSYGVPVLYVPGKSCLIRNVGRAAGFVGQP